LRYEEGHLPLLISVPHDGRHIPEHIADDMTAAALKLPDTDWEVARLYEFARRIGAHRLIANYSRYVVDLNRPADDAALYPGQLATGLCPSHTFGGEPLYVEGRSVSADEQARRVERYWQPYHLRLAEELDRLRARHGVALLWDAHSIASRVPSLFDGQLPDLNIGTDDGRSCEPGVQAAIVAAAKRSSYSLAVNDRFRGGYITRRYGQPDAGVYAVQLELSQRCYLDERSLRYDAASAKRLSECIAAMLEAYLDCAKQ